MRHAVRERILDLARVLLARPRMQWLARLLFDASLRGLGVLNWRNPSQTGERMVLERLARALASGDLGATSPLIALDVGANEGAYAALCLEHLSGVELDLFEPHPRTVARLERRFGSEVRVTAAAAGSHAGEVKLFDYEDGDGTSHASVLSGVFTEIHGRPARSVAVPVVTLDEHLAGRRGEVLLLKVDTEGSELDVLRGAAGLIAARRIHCVQFEFNEMNVVSRVFLRDFAAVLPDFSFHRLLPRGLTPLDLRPTDEQFAYQNILAVREGSPVARYLLG